MAHDAGLAGFEHGIQITAGIRTILVGRDHVEVAAVELAEAGLHIALDDGALAERRAGQRDGRGFTCATDRDRAGRSRQGGKIIKLGVDGESMGRRERKSDGERNFGWLEH